MQIGLLNIRELYVSNRNKSSVYHFYAARDVIWWQFHKIPAGTFAENRHAYQRRKENKDLTWNYNAVL